MHVRSRDDLGEVVEDCIAQLDRRREAITRETIRAIGRSERKGTSRAGATLADDKSCLVSWIYRSASVR